GRSRDKGQGAGGGSHEPSEEAALCHQALAALETRHVIFLFDRHGRKMHPVATTGSRTSYACNHSFASRTSTHWQDFAAQRREHRDDPLLRTDQDAADAATHREWPSRLWRDGAAHARFHTPFTRAGGFAQ